MCYIIYSKENIKQRRSIYDKCFWMGCDFNSLKKLRDKKRRHLFEEEDRIAEENERLQEEMRKKLIGKTETKHIFTIRFEIK